MAKKQAAVFTVVQDEDKLFKIWYQYYSKFFPIEDIYVIACSITRQSPILENINCNIEELDKWDIVDNMNLVRRFIHKFKTQLLKTYKYVIFADVDEIIYHPDGLDNFLDNANDDYYTTTGYEIVQSRRNGEDSIDFNKPILSQRSYWYRCPTYDKTLVVKKDITWGKGNHSIFEYRLLPTSKWAIFNLKPNRVSNLYLIHLHKIDYQYRYQRNLKNLAQRKNPPQGGAYNFYTEKKFDYWWGQAENKLMEIPEIIKQADFV